MNAKRITSFLFKATLLIVSSAMYQCSDTCEETSYMVYYEPVYSTSAEVKAAVKQTSPRDLSDIGRIYFKDGILFINEVSKGIHIIDNRDVRKPVPLSFLVIPGNYDLSIKGNYLYADSFVDLVIFDISDLSQIKEITRIEHLFNNYTTMGMMVYSNQGILTDWKKVENVTVQKSNCNTIMQPWGGVYYDRGFLMAQSSSAGFSSKAAFAPATVGKGGSMARFTISGNHLYGLDGAKMDIVDISNLKQPKSVNEIEVTWDAETLFPNNSNLFVGSRSGMLIYDLIAPDKPVLLSTYSHVRSCDPVVVDGDYAFVTLRSGTTCEGFTNQLEVIDIKNLSSPSLRKTYPMANPHGLGVDNKILFICDGAEGLKIYDASNVDDIGNKQLAHYKEIDALDVIPYQNVAMVIGKTGLYQYDYSNLKDIKLISQLPIINQ